VYYVYACMYVLMCVCMYVCMYVYRLYIILCTDESSSVTSYYFTSGTLDVISNNESLIDYVYCTPVVTQLERLCLLHSMFTCSHGAA
jgi:hypothetical protein